MKDLQESTIQKQKTQKSWRYLKDAKPLFVSDWSVCAAIQSTFQSKHLTFQTFFLWGIPICFCFCFVFFSFEQPNKNSVLSHTHIVFERLDLSPCADLRAVKNPFLQKFACSTWLVPVSESLTFSETLFSDSQLPLAVVPLAICFLFKKKNKNKKSKFYKNKHTLKTKQAKLVMENQAPLVKVTEDGSLRHPSPPNRFTSSSRDLSNPAKWLISCCCCSTSLSICDFSSCACLLLLLFGECTVNLHPITDRKCRKVS